MTTPEDSSANDVKDTITFRHKESKFHRVIYVDGVFGGITPTGQVHMVLYNERHPIPDSITYFIAPDSDTLLGSESQREQRKEIHREMEISIVMNPPAVEALHQWLGQIIEPLAHMNDEGNSDSEPQDSK